MTPWDAAWLLIGYLLAVVVVIFFMALPFLVIGGMGKALIHALVTFHVAHRNATAAQAWLRRQP